MLVTALIFVSMVDASETFTLGQADHQYDEVSAEQIIANANSSPIIYDRIVISGDLKLEGPQYNPIIITNSAIRGNVSGKGITFYSNVDFSNTTFEKDAIFNESKFMAEANFNASRFYGTASFNMSRFPEGGTFDFVYFGDLADFANVWFDKFGTFYNATFTGDALFYLSEFNGAYANFEWTRHKKTADFSGSQFNAYSSFEGAIFEESSDFLSSRFSHGANFAEVMFLGNTTFTKSHFAEDSMFSDAAFSKMANFENAKFDGPTYFDAAQFHDDVRFNNAQFLAPAEMTGARFDKDLEMNSTKISKMALDGSVFNKSSKLFLAKADINKLMVSWSLIKDILSFDTSAYLSLVKNYKDLGQSNEANDCYYEYRYLNQNNKAIGFSKLLDVVAWLSCGYGVKPHYALYCGLIVILVFSAVLLLGRGVDGFHDLHGRQLLMASLYYSTIAFTANSKGLPLKGNYKYMGIAEGIIGWLLMALFLVTLGRLMIG